MNTPKPETAKPHAPGTIQLRHPPADVYTAAKHAAVDARQSLTAWIYDAMRKALAKPQ